MISPNVIDPRVYSRVFSVRYELSVVPNCSVRSCWQLERSIPANFEVVLGVCCSESLWRPCSIRVADLHFEASDVPVMKIFKHHGLFWIRVVPEVDLWQVRYELSFSLPPPEHASVDKGFFSWSRSSERGLHIHDNVFSGSNGLSTQQYLYYIITCK
jgi:hypothetical protein